MAGFFSSSLTAFEIDGSDFLQVHSGLFMHGKPGDAYQRKERFCLFSGHLSLHFPEWEYSLYTHATSTSVKTSPTQSRNNIFTFRSSCHLLPLSLSWRTCSDTFSPSFPCDPTPTVFSLHPSPTIQQLLPLSTSIFPLLPHPALRIPPSLLGSGVP